MIKTKPVFYDVLMSEAPRIVFNNVQEVTTRNKRNPKLTFVATNRVKYGFNLLHNPFQSISAIVRKNWIPWSQQVFKAKC